MTTYEPGTVAVATVRGVPNVRVIRIQPIAGATWVTPLPVAGDLARHWDEDVTDIRLLVVLDLDDPAATVEYLKEATDGFDKAAHGMDAWSGREPIRRVWAQIEAQTKPPRIPEPGLWGVVRDATGEEWVRTGPTQHTSYEWLNTETADSDDWAGIKAPTLVRPGVEDES